MKLGVYVINISIGDDSSALVKEDDALQQAIRNAYMQGVVCCVSAGNSGTSLNCCISR